jgi:tRNA-Thr(GGU) m(6)t(6)A37 methyltransferase TsaA
VLEIFASYHRKEAFRGLASFSHVWLLFVFHATADRPWQPTVRPPRLGGNQRIGVFASRSGFRPNPIGQSVVELAEVRIEKGRFELGLRGVDLLDGTPVLDVKPYLPYADSIRQARGGYAATEPEALFTVIFSDNATADCQALCQERHPQAQQLIRRMLALDPRPAYHNGSASKRTYGMRLWDINIKFSIKGRTIVVEKVEPAHEERP